MKHYTYLLVKYRTGLRDVHREPQKFAFSDVGDPVTTIAYTRNIHAFIRSELLRK